MKGGVVRVPRRLDRWIATWRRRGVAIELSRVMCQKREASWTSDLQFQKFQENLKALRNEKSDAFVNGAEVKTDGSIQAPTDLPKNGEQIAEREGSDVKAREEIAKLDFDEGGARQRVSAMRSDVSEKEWQAILRHGLNERGIELPRLESCFL